MYILPLLNCRVKSIVYDKTTLSCESVMNRTYRRYSKQQGKRGNTKNNSLILNTFQHGDMQGTHVLNAYHRGYLPYSLLNPLGDRDHWSPMTERFVAKAHA